jgi:hypothetical protein
MYNDEHLPNMLNYKSRVTSLALRYRNSNPSNGCPYLALYPLEDAFFTNGTFENWQQTLATAACTTAKIS